jgi:hypothetical protein
MPPGSFDRLLPLPPFHHDYKSGKTSVKKEDMQAYISNITHPLQHTDVFGDLASFLSDAAKAVS